MANIERFCASDVYDTPKYAQGIKVTGAQTILFLAGQVAFDHEGGVCYPGDFKRQAWHVFRAIKSLVESQGGTLQCIVKLNTYLTDIRYRADLIPIREEVFEHKLPAGTLVQVSALAHPDWLIEVDAIAVI